MKRREIPVGTVFGDWTVIGPVVSVPAKKPRVLCRCVCGGEREVQVDNLRGRSSASCGCTGLERRRAQRTRHGGKGTPEYDTWCGMKQRCCDPKAVSYPLYGGRGIQVGARWLGPDGFANFLQDVGPRPSPAHSLEREDTDGHYDPETNTVRWATREEQARNKRNNHRVTIGAATRTLAEWAERVGVSASTLQDRLAHGWDPVEAIFMPVLPAGAASRRKTHCPRGHEYTEANTYRYPNAPSHRQCRQCQVERRSRAARGGDDAPNGGRPAAPDGSIRG